MKTVLNAVLLLALALSFTAPALAQELEAEPQVTVVVLIYDADGNEQGFKIAYDQSIYDNLLTYSVAIATRENVGAENPDFDATKPIAEDNQPLMPVSGIDGFAHTFSRWLVDAAKSVAGVAEAQQLAATKQQRITQRAAKAKAQPATSETAKPVRPAKPEKAPAPVK